MGALAVSAILLFGASGPTPTLREAIDAYQHLDDATAIAAFHAILDAKPPREVAAKAHLYLGLIAFNALKSDLAYREFKQAIETNSAIDLPADASPKASLAFAEARREVIRELAHPEAVAAPAAKPSPSTSPSTPVASEPAPAPAPAVAIAAPVAASPPPSSHSHVLAFSLGGAAVALGVVAAIGGAQVISYNGMIDTANGGHSNITGAQIKGAQGSANFWSYGWIAFAAGGAAALAAGVLTW